MIRFKKNIVLLNVFFLIIILLFGYSKAWLKKEIVGTNINFKVGQIAFLMNSTDIKNNQTTLRAREGKILNFSITSNQSISSKYVLYYKIIRGSDNVQGGHITGDYDNELGILKPNESRKIGIYLKNNDLGDVVIEIGIKGGLVNNEVELESNEISLNQIIKYNEDDIYITNTEFAEIANAKENNNKVNYYHKNILDTNIALSKTDTNTYVTYKITVYNASSTDYYFDKVQLYTNENENIVYEIEDLVYNDVIVSNQKVEFKIKFFYKNNELVSSNKANIKLKFRFLEVDKSYLLNGTLLNTKIKNSTEELDYNVKKIIFGKYSEWKDIINWDDYESFLDSEEQGSIRLFRLANSDNTTNVYILSDRTIYANTTSDKSFTNLRALEEILFYNYDTSQMKSMLRMFYMYSDNNGNYESSLKNLDLSDWDTSNVTNMRAVFGYNTKLEYLNISTWDTSNVENMGYLFQALESLTELDVTSFNTSNVELMEGMFMRMGNLTELDLSSFDTSKVITMSGMFDTESIHGNSETSNLKTIYVSKKFVTNSLEDTEKGMFLGCVSLVGGNGTKYNSEHIDANYAVIDQALYDDEGNYMSGLPGYFTLK